MEFRESSNPSFSNHVFFDIEDVDLPNKENLSALQYFSVKTYVNLFDKKHKDNAWNVTYASINKFFSSLNKEDKQKVAAFILLFHKEIKDSNITDNLDKLPQVLNQLSVLVDSMDQQLKLCDKLREFVCNNLPIGIYEAAGTRAQDTPELTFVRQEVIDLTTIALLCKMLSPVFGEIMRCVFKQIDTKSKEIQCVSILNNLLNRRYIDLITKLQDNYISHILKGNSNDKDNQSMTIIFHGHSKSSLIYYMFATLLVRQFVNVDLVVPEGNLMVYILVSVKQAYVTFIKSVNAKPTRVRIPISANNDKGDGEGNIAQIEVDSIISTKTIGSVAIIAATAKMIIKQYLKMYNITEEEFEKSMKYFRSYPIMPTKLNRYVNSIFFSDDLGGSRSIYTLKNEEYTSLTALVQCIMFSLDIGYRDLAHMLTSRMAIESHINRGIIDNPQRLNAGGTEAYKKCKARFDATKFGVTGKDWDNQIKMLTDDLITNAYIYNTPPWLWNCYNEQNLNGRIIPPTEYIMGGLCCFYDFIETIKRKG